MLNEIVNTLAEFDFIPKRLSNVVSAYIGSLALVMKRHTYASAADLSGLDQSRFCALLNNPETREMSEEILSRSIRRRLKRIKQVDGRLVLDRKSTRLNSSHQIISYAVFCLKKKKSC